MREIILFIIMIPVYLFSQGSVDSRYELSVASGIGSYAMLNLKDLQNTAMKNNPLALIKTTSFPAYYNYSFRYGTKNGNKFEGITGGLMSTGARSSLADYSGYYTSDIDCMAFHAGYYNRTKLMNYQLFNQALEIGYLFNGSFIYSSVTMTDNLQLYGIDEAIVYDSYTFNSVGVYTEPMLYATYMFCKYIGIEFNAGGALSISSPLYYESIKNVVSIYDKNRFSSWTGYRLSIGIISRF